LRLLENRSLCTSLTADSNSRPNRHEATIPIGASDVILLSSSKLVSHCIRSLAASACLLVAFGVPKVGATDGPVLVGVLEEVPGVYVGESSHYGVRALFRQVGENWEPFPDECANTECLVSITSKYPAHVLWKISFEGRALGTVSAQTPADFAFYAHMGLQSIQRGQPIPAIGSPSVDYSGFQETPLHRPLMATAGPAAPARAHGRWRLQAADAAELDQVWAALRPLVPLIDDCRLDSRGEYIPSNGRSPHRDELEIASTWVNRSGDAILDARIRPAAFANCDGPPGYRSEYWFYRESSGKIWPLPGQGDGTPIAGASTNERAALTMPLDFVDILGNGQDVAIFLMSGYDAGGYALFFDGFRRVAHFTWIYH